jgi:hypothetical protein
MKTTKGITRRTMGIVVMRNVRIDLNVNGAGTKKRTGKEVIIAKGNEAGNAIENGTTGIDAEVMKKSVEEAVTEYDDIDISQAE